MSKNITDDTITPVLYLGTPYFGILQSLAVGSITVSFVLTIVVLILSFKFQGCKTFYSKWTFGQRFCVYVSICDCYFNFFHGIDHAILLKNKNYVESDFLCEFFGFFSIHGITVKYLLVLSIALITFYSVAFMTEVRLGKRDWKFLAPVVGLPTVAGCILWSLGYLGPAGYSCFIKDPRITTFVSVIPNILISFSITVAYILTWGMVFYKKRHFLNTNQWTEHRQQLIKSARNMILNVSIFLLQFIPGVSVIITQLFMDPPFPFFIFSLVIINLGGMFDMIVFCIQRKKATVAPVGGAPQ